MTDMALSRSSRCRPKRSSRRFTRPSPRDFDGDGHTDLLVAGNFFGVPPLLGRYDASYGSCSAGGRRALRRDRHGCDESS